MTARPPLVVGGDGLPQNLQAADALIASALACGPHLLGLPNSNFEDAVGMPGAAGSYARGWAPALTGTGSTLLDTTAANKLTGANSVKLVLAAAGDTATYAGPVFPCGAGIPFFAYARAKSSGQAARLTVTINYFTNSGTTGNGSATLLQTTGLPAAYAEYGAPVTPPSGTSYAQIVVKVDMAADTVWVDEVRAGRSSLVSDAYYTATGTGSVSRSLQSLLDEARLSVRSFGAYGDTVSAAVTGTVAANSTAFSVSSSLFVAADAGKWITIPGAGASGAPLYAQIAAVVSATAITLGIAASTALSSASATIIYGHDDTSAIMTCFAAAVLIGRVATIPRGNYTVTQLALTGIHAGLAVQADPNAVLRLAGAQNTNMLNVGAAATGVIWSGGQFDGNGPNNPTWTYGGLIDVFATGFRARDIAKMSNTQGFGIRPLASDCAIERCFITGTVQTCIFANTNGANCSRLIIRDNVLEHLTQTFSGGNPSLADMGIQVHTTSGYIWDAVKVEGNHISLSTNNNVTFNLMGIEILGADANSRVTNYTCNDNTVMYGGQSISVGFTQNGTIVGNTCHGFSQYGIEVAQSNLSIAVTGNVSNGSLAAHWAMWLSASNSSIAVCGNALIGGGEGGIYLYNTEGVVSGNTILSSKSGTTGIYANTANNIEICGNHIEGSFSVGINVTAVYIGRISDNAINGATGYCILYKDSGTAGTYFFQICDNFMVVPSGSHTIGTSIQSGGTYTGSQIKGNTSNVGYITDTQYGSAATV